MFPLTEEQRAIVEDRGGELLVSAAAGSGKTRVLVERLLDRVTQEGIDIDSFLVITYTKAAAAELRTRVAQELAQRLAQQPNDSFLRRQAVLIYRTQISTIHSFCSRILRENGHLLDLDPDFRLCEENEGQILQIQVLEEVLDRQYEQMEPNGDFSKLVDTLSAGRDDRRLAEIVLDVFRRIQSHERPERWLEEQRRMWNDLNRISGAEETIWGHLVLDQVRRRLQHCRDQMWKARQLADQDELLARNYGPSLEESFQALTALLDAAETGWDAARAQFPVPFPRVGTQRKRKKDVSDEEEQRALTLTEQVKAIRSQCKKQAEEAELLLDVSSAEALTDLIGVRPAVTALLKLVGVFSQAFQEEKRRRGLMDFSDLEHFAVQLLQDAETGQLTELARHWSGRYAEVMVDEYQDTNQVQNAIFYAISEEGRKLFQVGDVKQSIYRFRLADPTIFLEKYRRFPDGSQAKPGAARRRVLSRNFRSRPPVLQACNDLFRNVMSVEFSELEYSRDQALVPGAEFPDNQETAVELDLLDLSGRKDQPREERESKDLQEARFVARRLREMLDKPVMIRQGEDLRPVLPGDMMILMRSPGPVIHHYLLALSEQGIPWTADAGEDFLQTTEVSVALSLLQIIDNPRQDVALIAALRSPVYGFTGDDLALIRAGRKGSFYDAVADRAREGNEKCARFLEELEELRFGMGERSCAELIWHLYERTNLLGLFSVLEGGRERRENLLALYTLAQQMEGSGCRSLFSFLLRLERLRETGKPFSAAHTGGSGGVSILSIHRSKGLERPVVVLCGLTRQFNQGDGQRPVLFHPEYGIGPKGLDQGRMLEYPTLARQAVALQLKREMMAEEQRLLYVAMTRAQEKLVLTMGLTRGKKTMEDLGKQLSVPADPVVLAGQNCVGHWVLLHAMTRPECAELRESVGAPEILADDLGPAWDVRWLDDPMCFEAPERRSDEKRSPEVLTGVEEDLTRSLNWSYPYPNAVDMPSKLTATQLNKDGVLPAREGLEEASRLWELPRRELGRPRFITRREGLTAAQRGTALHMAMQYLPITETHDRQNIREELARLAAEGFLTAEQVDAVQPERLMAFYDSPLGRQVQQAARVQQEFKFSVLVPAEDYAPGTQGEQVLLQGVIDCWFRDENGDVTILDFKSDCIKPETKQTVAETYRPQLDAYAKALSMMLEQPIKRKILWFFALDEGFEIQ